MQSQIKNKKHPKKKKSYSIIRKLRKEGKLPEEMEIFVSNLSLEDLIALKLELSVRPISNRLYGLPIWDNLPNIVQEAVLKYAVSATRSQGEAMRFLGLKQTHFSKLMHKYKIDSFFTEEDK